MWIRCIKLKINISKTHATQTEFISSIWAQGNEWTEFNYFIEPTKNGLFISQVPFSVNITTASSFTPLQIKLFIN